MRKLGLWLVIVGALGAALAGAGWYAASAALRSAAGVLGVTHEDASVRGFPLRFDVALPQPVLPLQGGQWQADALRLSAPAYWPLAITAQVPAQQRLMLAGSMLHLDSESAEVGVNFRPGLDLPLDVVRAHGAGLRLAGRAPALSGAFRFPGAEMALLTTGAFSLSAQAEGAVAYAVTGEVAGMALNLAPLRIAPSDAGQGQGTAATDMLEIARAGIDAVALFDRRFALAAQTAPRLVGLSEVRVSMDWGASTISLQGAVEVDATGLISGILDLRVDRWQEALEQGRAAGLWDARFNTMLTMGAATFAAADADQEILRAPVTIRDGVVRLGPLTLANLPPLH
ncbi:DUF2125 domain-containing protein [Roseicitreum antarcticum]|uniref:DUF2125 domain-containing protein n=1 Tax=Roseicitreum antarcticum TaxID=564137 RepID=A0A1H2URD4_9RHOB|nr:DUF2125 domain-containing protein [Roseicitreum antarcticum]SDW58124.1 hypothetical protein SAMN04488238_102456 [Roseicitreum antarcticum]